MQTESRLLLRRWQAAVAAAASATWPPGQPPFGGDLELRVTHYSERRVADRDNLLKPIQDALERVCYWDDKQIKDATSNWRNIGGTFVVQFISLPLAQAFSTGREFLHIRLWASPVREDLG